MWPLASTPTALMPSPPRPPPSTSSSKNGFAPVDIRVSVTGSYSIRSPSSKVCPAIVSVPLVEKMIDTSLPIRISASPVPLMVTPAAAAMLTVAGADVRSPSETV